MEIQITKQKHNPKKRHSKKCKRAFSDLDSATDILHFQMVQANSICHDKVTAQPTHKRTHRSMHSNHSNFFNLKNSDQSKCGTPG